MEREREWWQKAQLYVGSDQCQHPEIKERVHWCNITDSILQNNYEDFLLGIE